jgi:HEAT repeat protein
VRILDLFQRRPRRRIRSHREPTGREPRDTAEAIAFHDLCLQLESNDLTERRRAAMLLSALTPRSAVRPLLRSYLEHGDRFILEALASYGDKLTLVAGREVANPARSTTERARLITVLGVSEDPAAMPILWQWVNDFEPAVHVAACAALANLGDGSAVELLSEALLSTDVETRRLALRATLDLDHPGIARLQREHVARYLAAGGAVPANVSVSMPLLLDPLEDVPRYLVGAIQASHRSLTIVIGPEAAEVAEHHREVLEHGLHDRSLFFATKRHSPDEQFKMLMAARDHAVDREGSRPVFVGQLPSPGSQHPPPHFLRDPGLKGYTARIVFVGQQEFAVVMEWWYYIEDRSEVDTDYHVMLTALTIGGDRMTEEERLTYEMLDDQEHDRFARALLAHRAIVGDALEGRSWLY